MPNKVQSSIAHFFKLQSSSTRLATPSPRTRVAQHLEENVQQESFFESPQLPCDDNNQTSSDKNSSSSNSNEEQSSDIDNRKEPIHYPTTPIDSSNFDDKIDQLFAEPGLSTHRQPIHTNIDTTVIFFFYISPI